MLSRYKPTGRKKGPVERSLKIRLMEKVFKTDDCWLFTGCKDRFGYGKITASRGRVITAHRASYEIFVGPAHPDMVVCHKCDNPPCVRPDHLFLGTHGDNIRDASKKLRLTRSADPRTRLEIINLAGLGWTQRSIADKYRMNRTTVGYIIRTRSGIPQHKKTS